MPVSDKRRRTKRTRVPACQSLEGGALLARVPFVITVSDPTTTFWINSAADSATWRSVPWSGNTCYSGRPPSLLTPQDAARGGTHKLTRPPRLSLASRS
jgi:hypothetical protein